MSILERISTYQPDLTAWRKDLHRHPEIAFEEARTSAIIAEKLAGWGIEVTQGIGGTGIVGTLRAGSGNGAIGLRADIDALPIPEENHFAHRSAVPGMMHACGHDGHTTMLLGAARYLAETRNFSGTVHFIFQPAEEGGRGARRMLDDGLFERFPIDAIYGAHNDPQLEKGRVLVKEGSINAAGDRFTITVVGRGGHAARPHETIDPLIVGCQIALSLQTLVSRRVDPIDSVVLSICEFNAGSAGNVIPSSATLAGTVRTLSPAIRDQMEERMRRLVEATAAAHEAEAHLDYSRRAPSQINTPDETRLMQQAAASVVGEAGVLSAAPPWMAGEDFSFFTEHVPGCYIRIGQRDEVASHGQPLHHPEFDFNDSVSPIGAAMWAALVERALPAA